MPALSVYALGLHYLVTGLLLYVVVQLLLVDHPLVVLTVVTVTLSLLGISRGRLSAEQLTPDAFHLVIGQFVPSYILRGLL